MGCNGLCVVEFYRLFDSDDGGLLLGFVSGRGSGLWKWVLMVCVHWVVLLGSSCVGGFVPFDGFLWQRGRERKLWAQGEKWVNGVAT